MKSKYSSVKPVIVLICSLAIVGCSYTVIPKNVPLIKEYDTVSLKDISVIVTNAEKDLSEYAIPTDTGSKSSLRGNRQAWSSILVEALAKELAKRRAWVSSKAPVTLSLALPEITFSHTKEIFGLKVKVLVLSSTGWQKNYEGIAESVRSGMESVTAMANRTAGKALAEAVKAMLGDAEFLSQLSKK